MDRVDLIVDVHAGQLGADDESAFVVQLNCHVFPSLCY